MPPVPELPNHVQASPSVANVLKAIEEVQKPNGEVADEKKQVSKELRKREKIGRADQM